MHKQRRRSCEDREERFEDGSLEAWKDVTTGQGRLSHQTLEEDRNRFPPPPSETPQKEWPGQHHDFTPVILLDFWPPGLQENQFPLF